MQHYIGVMSGTSMDGIDLVLCALDSLTCKLLHSVSYPLDSALKTQMLELIAHGGTLEHIGGIDQRLGRLYAQAVEAFIDEKRIDKTSVSAIGLHGQTLWHAPDKGFSMQLGNPNVIAAQTGLKVICDFRRMDMAYGGQGAPFAPAFHRFIFGKESAVVNIGGMANITLLHEPLVGFDTGPGNVLLDLWASRHIGTDYDENGAWAASGRVDETLLKRLMNDPYFEKKPPKSTGREYFNAAWLEKHLEPSIKPRDVQATLLELTAQSIAQTVDTQTLIVCGGGAKNSALMARLEALLEDVSVSSSDAYGYDSDALEAAAFAWLAYKRLHDEPVALKSVTGATHDALLGGIYG